MNKVLIKFRDQFKAICIFFLFPKDLCAGVKCNDGERCVTTESEAKCECIDTCDMPKDDRQKVLTIIEIRIKINSHHIEAK